MLLLKPVVGERPLLNLGTNDEASDVFGGRGLTRTYLKNNLSAHGSVAKRFKMLTYYVYAPLSHRFAPPAAGFRKAQLAS